LDGRKMAARENDKEFIETTVKAIVDNPGDVKVARDVDEMGVLLTLQVNSEDMGQIIGKNGSTAKALRTLLRVIGAKNRARVNLKIVEPEGSERRTSGRTSKKSDVEDVVNDLKL
jgi:predicted RNA-binding protein YlqC (UPF0109 family)